MLRRFIRWLVRYLSRWTPPFPDELVLCLSLNTANLCLAKNEFVEFAPIKGACSPIRLTGGMLPIFEYKVFEKKIMEFIHVRVELSKPERIHFIATIDSTTAPERHGEVVDVKGKYKEPFIELSQHLFRYFPFYRRLK